jgi:hypothetical protein
LLTATDTATAERLHTELADVQQQLTSHEEEWLELQE